MTIHLLHYIAISVYKCINIWNVETFIHIIQILKQYIKNCNFMSNFKKEMNMIDKMINQTLCALTMN